jgi:hypothetical protein
MAFSATAAGGAVASSTADVLWGFVTSAAGQPVLVYWCMTSALSCNVIVTACARRCASGKVGEA